jgi:cystathionine beta-lyase
MPYNFDALIERRGTGSRKWNAYPPDVLPMWIADMDFRVPQPVIDALAQHVQHGVFGYEEPSQELALTICERMSAQYGWAVQPDHIVFLPGVITGFNAACRAFADPGDSILVQTPVYPPMLAAPANNSQELVTAPLRLAREGSVIRYEVDLEAFEQAISPRTRLFLLCHPHNPAGLDFSQETLAGLADICLRHDVVICSDEIHCDLVLGKTRHQPAATLSPEVANRCVTLMAPSKTYNIPGLGCSFAIIQNRDLRERFCRATSGIVPNVNALGLTAALAAYRHGDEWLSALLSYLTANRDFLVDYVQRYLPQLAVTVPQATYLAWLDCRQAGIAGSPSSFFIQHARVAFNDGAAFGAEGVGFVRLNFGTPRSLLKEGLDRIRRALEDLEQGSVPIRQINVTAY